MTEADRIARYETAIAALWQADGAHDIGHLRRVWRMARLIAMDEPGADGEILLAAAYFHDAVNLPKDSPDRARASTLSADLAVKVLPDLGFPAEKLPALHHAIAAHSFSARIPCETLEARILQDADRLEAWGAIGLEVKLFGLVDTMNTDTGRAIARERAEWMESFRTRLLSEIGA